MAIDADASRTKASTRHLESRSELQRSFKVTHFGITAYYWIIAWALEAEILKERSERLRFWKPTVIRHILPREPLRIFTKISYF